MEFFVNIILFYCTKRWKWFTANVFVGELTPTSANVGTYVGMLITASQTKATVGCTKWLQFHRILLILSQFEADLKDSERLWTVLSGFEQFWVVLSDSGWFWAVRARRGPLLQPGRAAGAPGAPANVGTFVDVVCFCKCWNNMFNILTHP